MINQIEKASLINKFEISTDKLKLNVNYIHHYLSTESYWAKNISLETVQKSINGSVCFGIYNNDVQIGFARVVTDDATFAYLADVFIDSKFRGLGLSKKLMEYIMNYFNPKKLRRMMLATKDAHGLYKQFGFNNLSTPDNILEIKFFEQY